MRQFETRVREMDSAFKTGVYFCVEGGLKSRDPGFARYVAKIDSASSVEDVYYIECFKKTTTKNPDWGNCFGSTCKIKPMVKEDFQLVLQQAEDSGRLLEESGAAGWRTNVRAVRQINADAKAAQEKRYHSMILDRWVQKLVESEDWDSVKYELCMEDSALLAKWDIILECAKIRLRMADKEKMIAKMQKATLRFWQAQLLTAIEKNRYRKDGSVNDRAILWVYDKLGGQGKTWFARFIAQIRPVTTKWLHNGPTKDMIKSVADNVRAVRTVMLDLSRCNFEKINWDAIERIKNGMIMSTKYHVENHIIESPSVTCFANFEPDLDKMSADRWMIFSIEEGVLHFVEVETRNGETVMGKATRYRDPDPVVLAEYGVKYEELNSLSILRYDSL